MKELSVRELHEVNGGNAFAIGLAIVSGITFLIGVIVISEELSSNLPVEEIRKGEQA